ncbi:MAG: hypothetical protein ACXVA2_15110 [Mucilaginibacter sp.]
MVIKLKHLFTLILCAVICFTARAQQKKMDKDMAKFFVGSWAGDGQFANGKKIAADVSFFLSTDSCSLINVYVDRAPNVYKATSAWSFDVPEGKFVAHTINNFTGLKEFTSEGWQNGRITISNQDHYKGGTVYQRFIYEKIDDDHFKVTYEYGRDSSKMQEGDHLIFERAPKK